MDPKWDTIRYCLEGRPTPQSFSQGHWPVDYTSDLTKSFSPLPLQNTSSCLIGAIIPDKTHNYTTF